jgi:hypothetical protein
MTIIYSRAPITWKERIERFVLCYGFEKVDRWVWDDIPDSRLFSHIGLQTILMQVERKKVQLMIVASENSGVNSFDVHNASGRLAFRIWLVNQQYHEELKEEQ